MYCGAWVHEFEMMLRAIMAFHCLGVYNINEVKKETAQCYQVFFKHSYDFHKNKQLVNEQSINLYFVVKYIVTWWNTICMWIDSRVSLFYELSKQSHQTSPFICIIRLPAAAKWYLYKSLNCELLYVSVFPQIKLFSTLPPNATVISQLQTENSMASIKINFYLTYNTQLYYENPYYTSGKK